MLLFSEIKHIKSRQVQRRNENSMIERWKIKKMQWVYDFVYSKIEHLLTYGCFSVNLFVWLNGAC